jgi:hypothetical protein
VEQINYLVYADAVKFIISIRPVNDKNHNCAITGKPIVIAHDIYTGIYGNDVERKPINSCSGLPNPNNGTGQVYY